MVKNSEMFFFLFFWKPKTSDELITFLRDSRGLESGLSESATFL